MRTVQTQTHLFRLGALAVASAIGLGVAAGMAGAATLATGSTNTADRAPRRRPACPG